MYKEDTVKREIRRLENARAEDQEEELFYSGALFALEWLLGKKERRPSSFVPWHRKVPGRKLSQTFKMYDDGPPARGFGALMKRRPDIG